MSRMRSQQGASRLLNGKQKQLETEPSDADALALALPPRHCAAHHCSLAPRSPSLTSDSHGGWAGRFGAPWHNYRDYTSRTTPVPRSTYISISPSPSRSTAAVPNKTPASRALSRCLDPRTESLRHFSSVSLPSFPSSTLLSPLPPPPSQQSGHTTLTALTRNKGEPHRPQPHRA